MGLDPFLFWIQVKSSPYNWRRLWESCLILSERDFGLAQKMEESSLHQPTIGPHQGNDNPHQATLGDSQHSYSEVNPQQRGDREQSGQTMHADRSQSRGKSRVSHAEGEKDMQREINDLKKKLRRARRYRQRSRTSPSEIFSGSEEYSNYRWKSKSTLHKGLRNKAMNEALSQVAKSPFMRRIECASLPR